MNDDPYLDAAATRDSIFTHASDND